MADHERPAEQVYQQRTDQPQQRRME
jgi:hypothetical protein